MITTIKDQWYETFFSGLNCELWERAVTPEWTKQEADFVISVLNVEPGATLLDIPCGFGRHTVELAKRGFSLTGIDISAEFLQTLRERINTEQLPIQVIHGNILTTTINDSFDGAYCLGNSFGYVDYDGMDMFVEKVANALKTGARFVINSGVVAESILVNFPKTNRYVLGDLTMDIHNEYVVGESYMATELTYTKPDRSEVHHFKHYVYTLSEIKRLLARHGLQTIAVYKSIEKLPYQLGDQQMYLVSEKS
ncbi:methyltransferase domain-containing protein [Spirosoma sp. BT702]|uniref:Methyltransferase domain-containing protein n=1 Tax=Spirosoma profusum TaxID=2771354 RepID=A0A926Y3N7_9BACT|nr:class I SAM-dependent methyltransferase [Spirosoma profusum]MBD2702006.1 methyltransferase domain-containing protein [Spirosoma profusum]